MFQSFQAQISPKRSWLNIDFHILSFSINIITSHIPKIKFTNHNSHAMIIIIDILYQSCHTSSSQLTKEIGYANIYIYMLHT